MRKPFALVMLFVIAVPAGCLLQPPGTRVLTGPELQYQDAETRMKEKKYPEALAIFRKISTESPESPISADALFEAAYINVCYDNPQRDYNQAQSGFDEFLKRFPDHVKAQEARNWRVVLKTIIDIRKDNERLTKSIEQLRNLDIRHEERRRQ